MEAATRSKKGAHMWLLRISQSCNILKTNLSCFMVCVLHQNQMILHGDREIQETS